MDTDFYKRKINFYVIIVAVAVIAGYVGYGLSSTNKPVSNSINTQYFPALNPLADPASIIKSQQAIAVGTITKLNGDTITIQGENKKEVSFSLDQQFNIYPTVSTSSATPPQPSHDKKDIILNKKAVVTLSLSGSQFKVVAISYLPDQNK